MGRDEKIAVLCLLWPSISHLSSSAVAKIPRGPAFRKLPRLLCVLLPETFPMRATEEDVWYRIVMRVDLLDWRVRGRWMLLLDGDVHAVCAFIFTCRWGFAISHASL